MNWVFLLALSTIAFAVGQLLQKVLVKEEESDPAVYAFVYQLTIAVIGTIVALVHGFVMPPITTYPLQFALVGVFYGLMNIFLFRALKHTEASDIAILISTRSFWTILIAVFVLGEVFTIQKWIGALIIFLAIFFANQKGKSFKLEKGKLLALLAAVFYAFGSITDAYLLRFSEPFSYTAINFTLAALTILLLQPKLVTKLHTIRSRKTIVTTLLLSTVYYSSVALFAVALSVGGKTSQMTPISQSAVILTVILAAIFLKERDRLLQKLFAAVLVVIGVILLR